MSHGSIFDHPARVVVTVAALYLTAMREFNAEGPIIAKDHYHISPVERVNLGEILEMIRSKR